MARKTIEQRLAELEAQRSALKARLSKTERNNDMRRKVLIGSLVLHHLETSDDHDFKQQLGEWLRRELPGFLTRDNDKALFVDLIGQGLPGTGEGGDSGQGAP
ncbi:mobilization protein [Rhizobium pusense]|uniref:mobilization protein n=1 Tax=Agrobacterium pusense TaxID=648995 RepID=UPI001FCE24A9|nr:mobilization protein [Agrobacterium pusense]